MKKLAWLLACVLVAAVATAGEKGEKKAGEHAGAAAKAEKAYGTHGKTHEVSAEIVSVDAVAKTVTIKGEKENKTVPVDEKAVASIKNLKPGQKVTLVCRDNDKGEHEVVTAVKVGHEHPM